MSRMFKRVTIPLQPVIDPSIDFICDFELHHKGLADGTITSELVCVRKVNRQEYIDSFADEVGILNILKKVALTGDVSLLGRERVQDGFTDLTEEPQNLEEAHQIVMNAIKIYEKLPESIRGTMTMEEFIKSYKEVPAEKPKSADDSKPDEGGAK